MIKVLFLSLRPDYHIINIDLYLVVNHIVEQGYHNTLIGCPNVLQPKWHNLVTKSSPLCNEGCLLHVLRCHFDLVVTRESIHEGKQIGRAHV